MRVRVKTLYKNHLSAYYKGDLYGEESHCFLNYLFSVS